MRILLKYSHVLLSTVTLLQLCRELSYGFLWYIKYLACETSCIMIGMPCAQPVLLLGQTCTTHNFCQFLPQSPGPGQAKPKPSQSQAKANTSGLAWVIQKPKPPEAKPKPVAFRPSQARTTLDMVPANGCSPCLQRLNTCE
jgi:hypothetical protein